MVPDLVLKWKPPSKEKLGIRSSKRKKKKKGDRFDIFIKKMWEVLVLPLKMAF